jgi:hypothetical protein
MLRRKVVSAEMLRVTEHDLATGASDGRSLYELGGYEVADLLESIARTSGP